MSNRSILLTLVAIAIALGFGIATSGCNRDRGRVASRPFDRRDQVRPAEVLSASAYRPPVRQPEYVQAPMMAQAPAIRVVPIRESQPRQQVRQPYYAVPAVRQPVVVHPTPELAMARASMPVPAYAAPAPTARQARPAPGIVPIPELEPARYVARVPQPRQNQPVMMTAKRQPNQIEIQRALEPLPQQGWVASPATAMRTGATYY